ncbi:MAG: hypothetical protein JNM69_36760, partial [Archangium sp.]|nr:hypothetical protein [Archangium sp.]
MAIIDTFSNAIDTLPLMKDATASGNLQVLRSLLGPAFRGMVQKRGKQDGISNMPVDYSVRFDWNYLRDKPELTRLYEAAKTSQWNGTTDLDWAS